MLAAIGDLIEDVVVKLGGPINHASDTEANVARRRGGSAANVCAVAAMLGAPTRLIAQVGDDHIGRSLVAELAAAGVDAAAIRFEGATGTIVVLVDEAGERTMLTDRRAALALGPHDDRWLAGVSTLHVPLYSLTQGRLAATARVSIEAAHARGIAVSVDASSVAEIERVGAGEILLLLTELRPAVVFANADEADALAIDGSVADAVTVVKRGSEPAFVHRPGAPVVEVAACSVGSVSDTTGAGDAFAAGFLTMSGWGDDPVGACHAGHAAAAELLRARAIC